MGTVNVLKCWHLAKLNVICFNYYIRGDLPAFYYNRHCTVSDDGHVYIKALVWVAPGLIFPECSLPLQPRQSVAAFGSIDASAESEISALLRYWRLIFLHASDGRCSWGRAEGRRAGAPLQAGRWDACERSLYEFSMSGVGPPVRDRQWAGKCGLKDYKPLTPTRMNNNKVKKNKKTKTTLSCWYFNRDPSSVFSLIALFLPPLSPLCCRQRNSLSASVTDKGSDGEGGRRGRYDALLIICQAPIRGQTIASGIE